MKQKKDLEKEIAHLTYLQSQYIKEYDANNKNKISKLKNEIISTHQNVFNDILEICHKKNIKTFLKFDEQYPIQEFYLESFIYDYLDILSDYVSSDSSLVDLENQTISTILNDFLLDDKIKQDFEIMLIKNKYSFEDKKQANLELVNFMKKYPQNSDSYETLCEWEYNKKNHNFKKIGQFLEDAYTNSCYVYNEKYYIKVIEYYYDLQDEINANKFVNMLHNMQIQLEDDFNDLNNEDYEPFDDDINSSSNFKNIANDYIEKGKRIEQYILEKNEDELTFFLGPQFAFAGVEKFSELGDKGIKKYVLNNYLSLIKSDLYYLPRNQIDILQNFPDDGILEINIYSPIQYNQVYDYLLLKQYGFVFMGIKDDIVSIAIPAIKQIKHYLKNETLLNFNKNINEKIDVLIGITEIFGALEIEHFYSIIKSFYPTSTRDDFLKIICLCNLFGKIQMDVDLETSEVTMIYNYFIDKKEANSIIKKASKITPLYSKDVFIRYSSFDNIIESSKHFKQIEKSLCYNSEDFHNTLIDILMQNSIDVRLGKNMTHSILKIIKSEFKKFAKNAKTVDFDMLKQHIDNLCNEFPKWK